VILSSLLYTHVWEIQLRCLRYRKCSAMSIFNRPTYVRKKYLLSITIGIFIRRGYIEHPIHAVSTTVISSSSNNHNKRPFQKARMSRRTTSYPSHEDAVAMETGDTRDGCFLWTFCHGRRLYSRRAPWRFIKKIIFRHAVEMCRPSTHLDQSWYITVNLADADKLILQTASESWLR